MLKTERERADFCREFNISPESFRKSCLTWEELQKIAEHFDSKRVEHQGTLKLYADALQECPGVHSLSSRVKETGHLIEKLIRKNPAYLKKGDSLSLSNYEQKITDLMGIRLLVLFKEEWLEIHKKIEDDYHDAFWVPPFVYLREGDDTSLYEGKVEIRKEKPYRSVHYVIRSKEGLGVEVQVRTLYEEAWSEIDHKLRYPYDLTNEMLANYLNMMNRLTGMGDEMGSFLHKYLKRFQKSLNAGVTKEDEVYRFILQEIEKCDDAEIKRSIREKIEQAENFFELKDLEGKVYFNEDIFDDCLIDILVDLERLKDFHNIDKVNYIKLMAYTASWCLKRKVFQIIEGCEKEWIYVNEKFALMLLLQASGCFDENVLYGADDQRNLMKNVDQIFYHLRYRNTNPQTLELLLVGLESGKMLCTVG